MRERGASFKSVLNSAIRQGLQGTNTPGQTGFEQQVFSLGAPAVSLDKALALAAASEDEELLRKQALGK